jgi:hypothetical protein
MTDLRTAAQQALEFICWSQFDPSQSGNLPEPPSTAPQVEASLRAALEQPEQEPVAWPEGYEPHELPADYTGKLWIEGQVRRLYEASPPRREWRSLSEEEIESLWRKWVGTQRPNYSFTRAVEAALRSKNYG